MNNILTRRLAVLILLLAGFSYSGMSQTPSTVGKDFYVTFLRNDKKYQLSPTGGNSMNPNASPDYYPTKLQLIITAKNACTGTITSANGFWTKPFSVEPGIVTSIDVPKHSTSQNR